MGRLLIIPKPHRPTCHLSRGTHLGALFCLFVFLSHFLLLLDHFHHLAMVPTSLAAGLRDINQIHLSSHEVPSQPFHDPSTCPICQEAQNSQDVVAVNSTFGPICPTFIQPLSCDGFWLKVTCFNLLVSGPRAPPIPL